MQVANGLFKMANKQSVSKPTDLYAVTNFNKIEIQVLKIKVAFTGFVMEDLLKLLPISQF